MKDFNEAYENNPTSWKLNFGVLMMGYFKKNEGPATVLDIKIGMTYLVEMFNADHAPAFEMGPLKRSKKKVRKVADLLVEKFGFLTEKDGAYQITEAGRAYAKEYCTGRDFS